MAMEPDAAPLAELMSLPRDVRMHIFGLLDDPADRASFLAASKQLRDDVLSCHTGTLLFWPNLHDLCDLSFLSRARHVTRLLVRLSGRFVLRPPLVNEREPSRPPQRDRHRWLAGPGALGALRRVLRALRELGTTRVRHLGLSLEHLPSPASPELAATLVALAPESLDLRLGPGCGTQVADALAGALPLLANRLAPGSPVLRRLNVYFTPEGTLDEAAARLYGDYRCLQVPGRALESFGLSLWGENVYWEELVMPPVEAMTGLRELGMTGQQETFYHLQCACRLPHLARLSLHLPAGAALPPPSAPGEDLRGTLAAAGGGAPPAGLLPSLSVLRLEVDDPSQLHVLELFGSARHLYVVTPFLPRGQPRACPLPARLETLKVRTVRTPRWEREYVPAIARLAELRTLLMVDGHAWEGPPPARDEEEEEEGSSDSDGDSEGGWHDGGGGGLGGGAGGAPAGGVAAALARLEKLECLGLDLHDPFGLVYPTPPLPTPRAERAQGGWAALQMPGLRRLRIRVPRKCAGDAMLRLSVLASACLEPYTLPGAFQERLRRDEGLELEWHVHGSVEAGECLAANLCARSDLAVREYRRDPRAMDAVRTGRVGGAPGGDAGGEELRRRYGGLFRRPGRVRLLPEGDAGEEHGDLDAPFDELPAIRTPTRDLRWPDFFDKWTVA